VDNVGGQGVAGLHKSGAIALKVGAWIWVGLAAILAIACLAEGWWLGVIAFVVSCVAALPLTAPMFDQRVPAVIRRVVGFVAGFAGFIAIGASAPTPKSAASSSPRASATTPATAASSPTSPPASTEGAKAAFGTFYDRIMETAQACDTANKKAVEAVQRVSKGSGSIYDGYGAAKAGYDQCRGTVSELGQIDVPDELSGNAEDKADAASDKCRDAYTMRMMSLETMMEIFDGDMKPSTVEQYRERAEASQAGVLLCVASLFEAASAAGVDLSKKKAD
jgi:hypothetical protein